MIPMAINEAKIVLETVKASPNKRMPAMKAPMQPIPVQMA